MQQPQITQVPYDEQAELSVLGAALIKPEALMALADLSVDDFYLPQNRIVLEAMRRVWKAGRPIDLTTVADELAVSGEAKRVGDGPSGAWNYLSQAAMDVPHAENVAYYAGIVADKARLRRLIGIGGKLISRATAGERAQDLGSEIMRELGGALTARGDLKPIGFNDNFLDVAEERAVAFRSGKRASFVGVPTRIAKLDEIIGGIANGETTLVAAYTSHGKSTLAIQIAIEQALAALQGAQDGGPALVFSFEMPEEQLRERMYCYIARVNSYNLKIGDLDNADFDRLVRAKELVAKMPLYIEDTCNEIGQVEARAAQFRAQHHDADILIVGDGLQLVSSRGISDERARIADVSWRFKMGVAKPNNAACLGVVQPNRTGKKEVETSGDMKLSDLRGAGNLEDDAATVMILKNRARAQKLQEGDAEIEVLKSRNGPIGTAHVRWIGRHYRFESSEPPVPPLGLPRGAYGSADTDF